MRHWKMLGFLLISSVSVASFAWLMTLSFQQVGGSIPAAVVAGKKAWQKAGCVECHAIFGNGGYNGSDLTDITERKSRQYVVDYLTSPPSLFPHSRRHPKVSDTDADAIFDFLGYIGNVNPKEWPPPPLTKP